MENNTSPRTESFLCEQLESQNLEGLGWLYLEQGFIGKKVRLIERESSNLSEGISKNIRRTIHLRRANLVSAPQVVISFMDQENILTVLATRGGECQLSDSVMKGNASSIGSWSSSHSADSSCWDRY